MNKEQAKKFYESQSRPKVTFVRYYKYEFAYSGSDERMELNLSYGGDADNIYRHEVDTSPLQLPQDFEELLRTYSHVNIKDKKTGDEFERE